MGSDWTRDHVFVDPGWRRLNDFCDTGPKGSGLAYTSTVCLEEIEECELGTRVVTALVEKAVDGWDALLQAQVEEDERRTTA